MPVARKSDPPRIARVPVCGLLHLTDGLEDGTVREGAKGELGVRCFESSNSPGSPRRKHISVGSCRRGRPLRRGAPGVDDGGTAENMAEPAELTAGVDLV